MKNTFTLGAVAGIASLALAVPLFAQISGAQDAGSSASSTSMSKPADMQVDTQGTSDPMMDSPVDSKKGGHVGANGKREELLTGTNAERATAAALEAVPGGTIDRVETDTEGDVYEAHMIKADGSRVTVKFDANFNVTRIEEGHGMKR